MCFPFGLLSEQGTREMENISPASSLQRGSEAGTLGKVKALLLLPYSLDFLYCVYGTLDEELLAQAMVHFQGIRLCMWTDMGLPVVTFCIKFCSHVKKLQLNEGGQQGQAATPGIVL
jgi:NACHT/LRR/PYD domain-containing protein 1